MTRDTYNGDEFFGVTLPAWSVYGLGVLMIGSAVTVPVVVANLELLKESIPASQSRQGVAVRPVMMQVPGGTFQMGSPESEKDRSDDETLHTVRVSSFQICQTEVTNAQWNAIMGTPPSNCSFGCESNMPVQNVSWYDAIDYLTRLTELENQARAADTQTSPTQMSPCYTRAGDKVTWNTECTGYRLPTEAEWEYAARARSATAYSFGDAASDLGEYAWFDENADSKVHPVGQRQSNAWFLDDMHGNVWEWVWDWYAPYPSADADKPLDHPKGPLLEDALLVTIYALHEGGIAEFVDGEIKTAQGNARVLRGGSFGVGARNLRFADRRWYLPADRDENNGFRCARGASPASSTGVLIH